MATAAVAPATAASAASAYVKLTHVQHILHRPDTYIGSVTPATIEGWWTEAPSAVTTAAVPWSPRFVRRTLTLTPGFLKCFDELLTNATDNRARGAGTTEIRVTVNPAEGWIQVWNNGTGIPATVHPDHGVYVPELVFGHLLAGSNFDDTAARTGAGRNGLGAKQANVFSTRFEIMCNDVSGTGTQYFQRWDGNMGTVRPPVLKPCKAKSVDTTSVTWWPDFARFAMSGLDGDALDAITKRVLDTAGTSGLAVDDKTTKALKVVLNGTKVPISGFKDYVAGYMWRPPAVSAGAPTVPGEEEDDPGAPSAVAKPAPVSAPAPKTPQPFVFVADTTEVSEWEFAVALNKAVWGPVAAPDAGFTHVSFVNGVHTPRGGTHVTAVVEPVVEALSTALATALAKARHSVLPPAAIRAALAVFVNVRVRNPAFDGQTKEALVAPKGKALGSPALPPRVVTGLLSSLGLLDMMLAAASLRDARTLAKCSGTKRATVAGIPKLEDAVWAGGPKAASCVLVITEGDSAKALALAGVAVVGRERFGVFPIRGKPLNVREVDQLTACGNAEVAALVSILGLQWGRVYDDPAALRTLRYGSVMIMADQDTDGSHIKGLLLNLLHAYWPSLTAVPGFITQFITPLLKAKVTGGKVGAASAGAGTGTSPLWFYTAEAYADWARAAPPHTVKYYKGLGTSTAEEGREYFRALDVHRVEFVCSTAADDDALSLAFAKGRPDDRKAWLRAACDPATAPAPLGFGAAHMRLPVADFVHRELVRFSLDDLGRSIPSVMDGLKPSQRKVLYACFHSASARPGSEIKVAQLAALVAQKTAYHHGEDSLAGTIVGMAQTFPGSNNVALLEPNGQFGTRLQGGKDAAAPRYIFTALTPAARALFPEADDALVGALVEDGSPVEPRWYAPVVPTLLINGAMGIGTGWSCSVPQYNPRDVVAAVRARLAGGLAGGSTGSLGPVGPVSSVAPLVPWVRGFTGQVVLVGPGRFKSTGVVSVEAVSADEDGCVVTVTELPIGYWVADFKLWLDAEVQRTADLAAKAKTKAAEAKTKEAKEAKAAEGGSSDPAKPAPAAKSTKAAKTTKTPAAAPIGIVKSHSDTCTDTAVRFVIELTPAAAKALREAPDVSAAALSMLQLERPILTTNMHAFDASGSICKYEAPENIVDAFMPHREALYRKRLGAMEAAAAAKVQKLTAEARFVREVVAGTLVVAGRGKAELLAALAAKQYPLITDGVTALGTAVDEEDTPGPAAGYQYLLRMPLWALTAEAVDKLEARKRASEEDLAVIQRTTVLQLWQRDLDGFEAVLDAQDAVPGAAAGGSAGRIGTNTDAGGAGSAGGRVGPAKPAKKRAATKSSASAGKLAGPKPPAKLAKMQ